MESDTFKKITRCRACDNDVLLTFIDLTDQPLANTYPVEPTDLPRYPLAVNVCDKCFHTQLTIVVDPDLLYRDYLYVSGTSQTLRGYCNWFAQQVTQNFSRPGKVLDIASNDGTQLDYFKALGWTTYGVDPARNLEHIAVGKGHAIISDYWDINVAERFNTTFDLITAQNVFAHTDNVMMFLRACRSVMHLDSRLLIQTSQANMYENGEFDTIYHEHLSFFNTRSMLALVERAGMHLRCVSKTNIHGTSYVFEIGLTPNDTESNNVIAAMQEEESHGFYDMMTYINFGKNAERIVTDLRKTIQEFRAEGRRVVGYGAAAKGTTVLNYGNIKLDYVVDDNPLKQGRYIPGMNIPIVKSDKLASEPFMSDHSGIVVVPLAWNFLEEIRNTVAGMPSMDKTKFIKYFPNLEVI